MANTSLGAICDASNLLPEDAERLRALINLFNSKRKRNKLLTDYYEAKIRLSQVDIGLAIPDPLKNLAVSCSWPAKAVDAVTNRSKFEGFYHESNAIKNQINLIVDRNRMREYYRESLTPELIHGLVLATLSMDDKNRSVIKWHTAESSAARWDGEHDRILDGFAIVDRAKYEGEKTYRPSLVNLYTPEATIVLRRYDEVRWIAEYFYHKMGRPLMEALIHNPSFTAPLGRSRITRPVMDITAEYMRNMARMSIAGELFCTPQKYLLGADKTAFDQDKLPAFSSYMTSMLAIGSNKNGDLPQIGQFATSSMTPFMDEFRTLANAFSGCTNVPTSELGLSPDGNPSSAEAIFMAQKNLVADVETINALNGFALKNIVLMAYCMEQDTAFNDLDDEVSAIEPKFADPSMLSISAMADAAIKISSVKPEFVETDQFWAMVGFDGPATEAIRAAMRRGNTNYIKEMVAQRAAPAINRAVNNQIAEVIDDAI